MDEKQRVYNENPYATANVLSKTFLCWLNSLMTLGRRKTLQEEDLYKSQPSDDADYLTVRLENEWKNELKKDKKPSMTWVLFKFIYRDILVLSLLALVEESFKVIQPILVANLIAYFEGQMDLKTALVYGFIICFSNLFVSMLRNPGSFYGTRVALRLRVALSGLIYRKAIRLTLKSANKSSIGNIVNLLATDTSRVEITIHLMGHLIVAPIAAIIIVVLLVVLVDFTFLAGLVVFMMAIPLQMKLGRLTSVYKTKGSKITDQRLELTSEVLSRVKIIKMNCWEDRFKQMIENIRKNELGFLTKVKIITAIYNTIDQHLTKLVSYTSVLVFIFATTNILSPKFIVYAIGYYTVLCHTIGIVMNKELSHLFAAKVAIKRIQEFLMNEDFQPLTMVLNDSNQETVGVINVQNLNADWKDLKDVSFNVGQGELLGVVGKVGSGKSSIFMALLGEMPNLTGDIRMNGRVFYVSQEPWIFSATIKQNITFGKAYDKKKFNDITQICALREDLKMLPSGQNTLIGDKGVNLSGGQRARISLARALYFDPEIYLLDDPLSAVDANVARHLFDKCINGYLKSKTRILITHQVHMFSQANQIIVFEQGSVKIKGTYQELISQNSVDFIDLIKHVQQNETEEQQQQPLSRQTSLIESIDEETFLEEESEAVVLLAKQQQHTSKDEKKAAGSVDRSVYASFARFGTGYIAPFIVLFVFVLSEVSSIAGDYWLSYWANTEENNQLELDSRLRANNSGSTWNETLNTGPTHWPNGRRFYFIIYSIIVPAALLIFFVRACLFYILCIISSKSFHREMLNGVIKTSVHFFDTNPIGRIVNRFAKDISHLDDNLPNALYQFLQNLMAVTSTLILAIYANYFIIIPIIPLVILFVYVRIYYASSSRELKRIESTTRSPIFSHASSTMQGLITVRACGNQEIFEKEFSTHQNDNTQAFVTLMACNRWFASRLESILIVYITLFTIGCIFGKDYLFLSPGQIGILFIYMSRTMNQFQLCIRQSVDIENFMTSVERIVEYTHLKSEPLEDAKLKPLDEWPVNGKISFENVSFAYDDDLPVVLKNVNLKINAHEKIGIVGRTGAGKSTIFQALLRIAEPGGTILIDGINIKDLSLHDLRSKIAIIPQEPTLFAGTIRSNLDPFNEHDDEIIWKTLETIELKATVHEMKDGLDAVIQNNASNLSVGQKQLFCLARAILKKSKILIIDEATANVDYKTDSLVQKAIRECFADCTVITIAHRLQTIMDNDRIVCMSNGQVENFDTPRALLENTNSVLYELISKLGETEFKRMLDFAKAH